MALENLVWHDHFWPGGKFPENDEDEIKGRFDACEDDQGQIFVWSAETKEIVTECDSREKAIELAKQLANASGA
jgi:hypothetical protein